MEKQLDIAAQRITSLIDWLNDKLTSYRLMLYLLLVLVGWAFLGSFLNQVPYTWNEIAGGAAWLVGISWLVNKGLSKFLDIPANKESDLITGLILTLILPMPQHASDLAVLAAAAAAAIASKYVITLNKSHIFNPAAFGALIAGEVFHKYPAWWVGTKFMTPIVIIGGLLVLRKMKRFTMAGIFLAVFILYLIFGTSSGGSLHFLWLEIISTQALFFAVVMLTEPLTSPVRLSYSLVYALAVGILYSATKLKFSPEEALLAGNLLTFLLARNRRYQLKFIRRVQEADGIYSYLFSMPKDFRFKAGQYMEWTVAHNKTDARGNRRYLTIASSPTEPGLMFTIKHPQPASAFKQKLDELKPGETILASRLAGEFILPPDTSKKIAFLAGGIGVTPFRSMIKYAIDKKQPRDMALLYSANSPDELSFQKLFENAKEAGLTPHYVTDGHIDQTRIKSLLPDYKERTFYISGPYGFVNAVHNALLELGVAGKQIVTDYFPGYGS
jgi:ferredoxin-NADP reductase/Na+-translocating ferredoxin:NAD+ oxidoreductase RnfD subunit